MSDSTMAQRALGALRAFVSELTAESILRLALRRGGLDAAALRERDADRLLVHLADGLGLFVPDRETQDRCVAALERALRQPDAPAPSQLGREAVTIAGEAGVLAARALARRASYAAGLGPEEESCVVLAVSELARNVLVHAGTGEVSIHATPSPPCVEIVARDHGPGIPDVAAALAAGAPRGERRARGLFAARAALDELTVRSQRGRGTEVRARKHGGVRG